MNWEGERGWRGGWGLTGWGARVPAYAGMTERRAQGWRFYARVPACAGMTEERRRNDGKEGAGMTEERRRNDGEGEAQE